jgi:hypothetical protein
MRVTTDRNRATVVELAWLQERYERLFVNVDDLKPVFNPPTWVSLAASANATVNMIHTTML